VLDIEITISWIGATFQSMDCNKNCNIWQQRLTGVQIATTALRIAITVADSLKDCAIRSVFEGMQLLLPMSRFVP